MSPRFPASGDKVGIKLGLCLSYQKCWDLEYLQGLSIIRGPTHVTQTDVWVSRGDTLSLFKRRGNPCSGDALC